MRQIDPLLAIMLGVAAAAERNARALPEMPAALPEGVDTTDAFRILKAEDSQALLHRREVNGAPVIQMTLDGGDAPEPLTLQLAYDSARARDIDFFRFDERMVEGALAQLIRNFEGMACTCGLCG